jgi:PIN domain
MTTKVLDSWALIAFFEDEPVADTVEELIHRAALDRHKLLMSVINWGEIYYNTMRETSRSEAEARIKEIASLPIEIVGGGDDLKMTPASGDLQSDLSRRLRRRLRSSADQGEESRTGDWRPGIQTFGKGNQNQLAKMKNVPWKCDQRSDERSANFLHQRGHPKEYPPAAVFQATHDHRAGLHFAKLGAFRHSTLSSESRFASTL